MQSRILSIIILMVVIFTASCLSEQDKQRLLQDEKEHVARYNFHHDSEGVSLVCERKDYQSAFNCWVENQNEFDVRIKSIRESCNYKYGGCSEITTDIYRLESHQKKDNVNPFNKFYVYSLEGVELGFLKGLEN